jgi:hypothetical protein
LGPYTTANSHNTSSGIFSIHNWSAKHVHSIQFSIDDRFYTTGDNTQKPTLLDTLEKLRVIEHKGCQIYFQITQRQRPFYIPVFMEAKVMEMRDLGFYVVIRFGNKLFPVAFTAHDTIAQ